jgi:hypothetical protein
MVQKFEAFSKNELDDKYYLGNKIKEPAQNLVSTLPDAPDPEASGEDIDNYIKPLLKKLSWTDLVLQKTYTNKNDYHILEWALPKDIMQELDKYPKYEYTPSHFNIYIENQQSINRTHFEHGLPEHLRGLGIAYKLYKASAKLLGYISSSKTATESAQNLWAGLIADPDFYALVSDKHVLLLDKKMDAEKITSTINHFVYSKISRAYRPNKKQSLRNMVLTNVVIKVDKELARDFRHVGFSKLNTEVLNRWKHSLIPAEARVFNHIQHPNVGQKIYMVDQMDTARISKVLTGDNITFRYKTDKNQVLNRDDFYVISE